MHKVFSTDTAARITLICCFLSLMALDTVYN
jgi:hypothetical protein